MQTIKTVLFILIPTTLLSIGGGQLQTGMEVENAFPNLTFTRPVELQHAGDGSNRLFVVEQQGIIYVFENERQTSVKKTFLDIRDLVNDSGNEEGLLGLAFHPDYSDNGYFYVDYTAANPRRTVIARYSVSTADSNRAEENSEFVILQVDQPYSNHNAGKILFGRDGYLYITLGDGGSGGDPQGNGQNRKTLLGSILRIDVDQTQGEFNYAIPSDNPFAGNSDGFRREIYAYGLRNPWKVGFDPETGWLWAADVGQNSWEEVDIIEKGGNYGWNIMEGRHCYNAASCDTTGLALPVWEYSHDVGQSVTGGQVYRGSNIPDLVGKYIYADYVSGRIWALHYDGESEPVNTLIKDTALFISAFGVDSKQNLYICAFDGRIYRFKKTATNINAMRSPSIEFRLQQNHPNPFNQRTAIRYDLQSPAKVDVQIFDLKGRFISTLINEVKPQGQHVVFWNGRDSHNKPVASGVYLCRFMADNRVETKKMLLIK